MRPKRDSKNTRQTGARKMGGLLASTSDLENRLAESLNENKALKQTIAELQQRLAQYEGNGNSRRFGGGGGP